MLEILAILYASRGIADIVERKGYNGETFRGLFIICWFGGELIGALSAFVFLPGADPETWEGVGKIYALSLLGAVIGGQFVFLLSAFVPARITGAEYLQDNSLYEAMLEASEYDRPRREHRSNGDRFADDLPPQPLVNCPHCHTALLVSDYYAGKMVRCSVCKDTFTVPSKEENEKTEWVQPLEEVNDPVPNSSVAPRQRWVPCPYCEAPLGVNDAVRGKLVRCRVCLKTFVVPKAGG
jgi:predicted Zn finger-like uncharacterized protein